MWIVVTYDVNTETPEGEKRLRRMAQACKNYGQRVQKSVFECQVSDMRLEKMRDDLLKIMNKEQDSLRLYRIIEPKERFVEEYGIKKAIDFDDPLII